MSGTELFAICLLCFAGCVALFYLIIKAASFFKKTFGKSLWLGVILSCLSVDLFLTTLVLFQNDESISMRIALTVASVFLFLITVIIDVRYYKVYAIPAFLLQVFLALLQLIVLIVVICGIMFKNTYNGSNTQKQLKILKYLSDI